MTLWNSRLSLFPSTLEEGLSLADMTELAGQVLRTLPIYLFLRSSPLGSLKFGGQTSIAPLGMGMGHRPAWPASPYDHTQARERQA